MNNKVSFIHSQARHQAKFESGESVGRWEGDTSGVSADKNILLTMVSEPSAPDPKSCRGRVRCSISDPCF